MTHYQMLETLVLTELRNLRRYAFCLTANRDVSEDVIESALEKLLHDSLIAKGTVSRLDLYRHVNERLNARFLGNEAHPRAGTSLEARLMGLPLHKRQIIVLSSVIGFPLGDVARIMDLPEIVVARAHFDALQALRAAQRSVLIVEDEALIARELSRIVTSLGLPVVGMAKDRREALRLVDASRPQIILADYQLRNGENGVDVVRSIREHIEAQVIYITAHPEAVRAGADAERDLVIAKPFHPRAVERALENLAA